MKYLFYFHCKDLCNNEYMELVAMDRVFRIGRKVPWGFTGAFSRKF